MSEPFRLTAEERKRLNEDGFVVREAVFSRQECAAMGNDVEQLERDLLAHKRNTKMVVGSYMFEALKYRDQWQSRLLRTSDWSPLY